MNQIDVQEHFRKQAADYVGFMERIIPQYLSQQKFLCELIPFGHNKPLKALDLGAGPGILSQMVLDMFPEANVLALDLTEEMLAECRKGLSPFGKRFSVQLGDFKTARFGEDYDVILAGLTLHHLVDEERLKVFKKIYEALKSGGIFLAREIVVDSDPFVTAWHYDLWRGYMRSNGEDDALWFAKHKEKDHPVAIERQLRWLSDTGFIHTACHWRYWNFAILSARKG